MIPKPKYIENILEITKSGKGFICCDVVCECGARHFIGYKNVIVRSTEEAAYEAAYNAFNEKYSRIRFGDENGISYLYAMKGLFGEEILEKFEYKQLDSTEIVEVKCAKCGKEYVLFDSHFHSYDATILERECKYDSVVYDFAPIVWKKDWDGLATFTIKIINDDSFEDFSKMNTKPTRKHIPTLSVGLP